MPIVLVRKLLMGYRSMIVCMMSMSRTFRAGWIEVVCLVCELISVFC